MLGWFHTFKFSGNYLTIFPDELTYINATTSLPYAQLVNYLFNTVGPDFFRILNIMSLSLIMIYILERLDFKYTISNIFIITLLCSFWYWPFFILKETLTVVGVLLVIISARRRIFLYLGVFLLLVVRAEMLILLLIGYSAAYVYNRSKKIFIIINALFVNITVWFMSLPISAAIKLTFVSRRFYEGKMLDDETKSAAALKGLDFLFSDIYIQTVMTNINRSYNFIFKGLGINSPLLAINFLAVFLFVSRFFSRNVKLNNYDFFFIYSILILIFTVSTYRYANAICVPYLVYILILNSKNNNFKIKG